MTCLRCGAAVESVQTSHCYREAGLSNVLLVDVEIRTCVACGERELVTPRLERLHEAIARALSRQSALLTAEAVSFLRKWLGLSAARFARMMGVRAESVYRWEHLDSTRALTPVDDHLLKLLVAHDLADRYPLELLLLTERRPPAPIVLVAPQWSTADSEPQGRQSAGAGQTRIFSGASD